MSTAGDEAREANERSQLSDEEKRRNAELIRRAEERGRVFSDRDQDPNPN